MLHRGSGHHRRQRSDAPVPQSLGGSMLHGTETLENPTRTVITGIRTPKRPAHTISSLMLRFWRAIPATKATINPRFSELCIKGKWASGRMVHWFLTGDEVVARPNHIVGGFTAEICSGEQSVASRRLRPRVVTELAPTAPWRCPSALQRG